MKRALELANARLKKDGVQLMRNGEPREVDRYIFNLFVKAYDIKREERYCYVHRQYSQPSYSYSMDTIDLLVRIIKEDPTRVVEHLKTATENKKS